MAAKEVAAKAEERVEAVKVVVRVAAAREAVMEAAATAVAMVEEVRGAAV